MSSLRIGIVGLPNVGKSTLFNALTKNNVLAANYPFATIEPNTGVVPVPDGRLEKLAKMFNSQNVIPATITFVDIAGLVAGAHKGEGMGNEFLSHVRETDAIVQVIRTFENEDVQHVHQSIQPDKDIEVINTELILADLQTIESHLPKVKRQAKGDPTLDVLVQLINSLKKQLSQDTLAINTNLDLQPLSYLNLLTYKPIIYVFNVDENTLKDNEKLKRYSKLSPSDDNVFISAKIESELGDLDDSDAQEFMQEYGIMESGLKTLAKSGYKILNLQSFITSGEKETKAWTIKVGTKAPQAAGAIHGDFERGFIAAEIVSYEELIAAGSWLKAKTAGKLRTEGRDYVMQEGDVVNFKFNV
jgi:ribosome-binding ATPase